MIFEIVLLAVSLGLAAWGIHLHIKLQKAEADYASLEQGMDEQDENYGQDFLDMSQKLAVARDTNIAHQNVIAEQDEEIRELKSRLSDLEGRSLPPFPRRWPEDG
jgi:hypothetical protein